METGSVLSPSDARTLAGSAPATTRGGTPWYGPAVVFAGACILIGIIWDISWHSTIGRDSFWTPAHMVIYLGGTLGGMIGGWLAFKTTFFGTPEERAASVRLWGMRAPLGAWVAIWGAIAMLASAPFDNWWHDAYGLDVKILSPPHSVLAAGMFHVVLGGWLLLLSLQNRSAGAGAVPASALRPLQRSADGPSARSKQGDFVPGASKDFLPIRFARTGCPRSRTRGSFLFVAAGGVLLGMASVMVTEKSFPNLQHTATYYQVSCGLYPLLMVALARASKWRWPATTMAAIYSALILGMIWILPLFAATPKLAPIYNPLTHMVPPAWPHLLVVPALAIDLLFLWIGRGRGWRRDTLLAVGAATSFTGLFMVTQWHFAKFLISPASNNWFFAGQQFFSFADPKSPGWTQFWGLTPTSNDYDPLTWKAILVAWLLALAASGISLVWGNWMARVKR